MKNYKLLLTLEDIQERKLVNVLNKKTFIMSQREMQAFVMRNGSPLLEPLENIFLRLRPEIELILVRCRNNMDFISYQNRLSNTLVTANEAILSEYSKGFELNDVKSRLDYFDNTIIKKSHWVDILRCHCKLKSYYSVFYVKDKDDMPEKIILDTDVYINKIDTINEKEEVENLKNFIERKDTEEDII